MAKAVTEGVRGEAVFNGQGLAMAHRGAQISMFKAQISWGFSILPTDH